MRNNKKGAALMQVLLITVILAGIATMLLRASLSRTTSARKTRRAVSAQVLIQACMAEINTLWSKKSPEAFKRDLESGVMYYDENGNKETQYLCTIPNPYNSSKPFFVVAEITTDTASTEESTLYAIEYTITQGSDDL